MLIILRLFLRVILGCIFVIVRVFRFYSCSIFTSGSFSILNSCRTRRIYSIYYCVNIYVFVGHILKKKNAHGTNYVSSE